MTIFNCYIVVIFLNIILVIDSQTLDKNQICNTKETCGDCIQENGCIWCSKDVASKLEEQVSFVRCIEQSAKSSEWCPEEFIKNPESNSTILKDLPLTSATSHNDNAIQFRPQEVKLKLRLNEKYKLNFQYSVAVDYPVDVYYLMDLSSSMKQIQAAVAESGADLAAELEKLSNNVRLGFGSFIDKVALPFTDSIDRSGNLKKYTKPYSFRNNLPLNYNITLFMERVRTAPLSYNIDPPEGGFDGILQSIVCEKQIGWRENATRLLIYTTDQTFHKAGDGALVGVVEPHDGGCYLNENGDYTHSLKFDYPSIAFINHYVKKYNIDLIFAVSQKKKLYNELQKFIEGSQVAFISEASNNVKDVVLKIYKKLKQSVMITDNAGPDIYIDYFTACSEGGAPQKRKGCEDVVYNKPINFTAEIKAISCKQRKHAIKIKPRSLGESLIIHIDLECDCDCADFEPNSNSCSSSGNFTCGICNCNPGRLGKMCECSQTAGSVIQNTCIMSNQSDATPCSGRGLCKCGKCVCDNSYSGAYCQCDNSNCAKSNNEICSGNGVCECQMCKCKPGFNGTACECDLREESCMAPGSKDICSKHGTCNCGKCTCQVEPKRFVGKHCELCANCPRRQCSEFDDCVICLTSSNVPIDSIAKYSQSECAVHCANVTVDTVETLQWSNYEADDVSDNNFVFCESTDADECLVKFKYTFNPTQEIYAIVVEAQKTCLQKIEFLPILLAVCGTILLIAIILLVIWKIFTEVYDRREYARFTKQQLSATWGNSDNPLYRPAVTNVKNPIYKDN